MIINNKFNYKKTTNVSRGTLVINKIKYYYFILYFYNLKYNILKFDNYYDNIFLCSTWNIEEKIL